PAADDSLVKVIDQLETQFPHSRESVNRELCELLVYAKSNTVLPASLKLLNPPTSQQTQVEIARLVRNVPIDKWKAEDARQYLDWLRGARRFRGGRLLPAEIRHLQNDFVGVLSDAWKREFVEKINALNTPIKDDAGVASRKLVRQWQLADVQDIAEAKQRGDAVNGRNVFVQAQCSRCHRMGDLGGQIGPDLSVLARRFDRQAMLEAIVQPSKVIDAKYAQATYVLSSGKSVTGRVAHVDRERISIETDPLAQTTIDLRRSEIETTSTAKTSPMPTGLLNYFSKEEIRDLLEFLSGAGK
ncbi:MAG: putative heme-binding domain-containing protein, partial [Pirellulaceae bacterium]